MPPAPEPVPWDRKDFFKERKHERSSDSLGSVSRWRETPHHREFRSRPPGHGKQGSWHMYPEEFGHGFTPSRSNEKNLDDVGCRPSGSRGDGKYSRNSRENRVSFSQKDWKGHSWENGNGSAPYAPGGPLDVSYQRSVDDMLTYNSHPHSDFVNTWEQLNFKDQHDKIGSVNGLGTGQRFDRENSMGSIDWKPLKWTRSGSMSSRGSGFSHSSSSKSMGVDSGEAKVEVQVSEEAIKAYPDERKLPYLTSESTFKITVDSFGKVISFEEQNDRIRGFSYIPFKGRVNLRNPDHKFWLMETDDYGVNNGLPPVVQRRMFFGREVGTADRKLLPTYQLKSRTYLGPTAMDAEMAFLMANQALVAPGKLVYDPFVGTGSILIGAAHFGAMTMGADIDIRVVRDGRGPDCNVWSNFKQYGLPMPLGLLRADNNLPPWRPGLKEVFDAIICDPPYGVRAGGRKSGGRKLLKGVVGPYTVPDDKRTDHIPSTAPYSLVECVHDLLDVAAKMLVMGGRLVFFYPILREDDTIDTNFPEHACFKLVASCEQILSFRYSRVLLTMVKIGPYTEEVAELARIKHLEFKKNHLKWLEEGNLRSAVFSPLDTQLGGAGDTKPNKDSKPKYRGKYV